MSSIDNKCSICQAKLTGDRKKDVTLSCKHTFHRDCAAKRLKHSKPDCPICRDKNALEHAIKGGSMDHKHGSAASEGKSKSQSSVTKEDSDEETWICSYCDKENRPSRSNCKKCGEAKIVDASAVKSMLASAFQKATGHQAAPWKDFQDNDHQSNVHRKDHDNDDPSPPVNRQRWNRADPSLEWTCDECDYANQDIDAVCKNCGQGKRPKNRDEGASKQPYRSPSPVHYSSSKPKRSDSPEHDYDKHSSHKASKSKPATSYKSDDDSDSSPPYHHKASSHSSSKPKRSDSPEHDYDKHSSHKASKSKPATSYKSDDDSDLSPPYHHAKSHSSLQHKPAAHSKSKHHHSSSSEASNDDYPPQKSKSKHDDYDNSSDVKSKSSKGKGHSSTSHDPVPIYISDFPLDITDDHQLENHIRKRVEKTVSIELIEIRCYSKLGVGVMFVTDKRTRDRILDDFGTLAWDPKDGTKSIRFIESLNLVSYIVFDVSKDKIDYEHPSAKEIMQQWEKVNHGQKPHSCEQVNMQFPNIFRIVSTSLEQLISSLNYRDIRINKHFGQIYFCADCSFFEDLPKSITQDQLETAILHTIGETDASSCSLYAQLNKQNGTACVIAANRARKWTIMSCITISGKSVPKRDALTCRLLIHPVPETLSVRDIIEHSDFEGKATIVKQNGKSLIVNVSDKGVFDNCLQRGIIRVSKKHVLNIDLYTAANNPEGGEIDADTWYDSDMLKCTKPDIMSFIHDPDHFIFRCKWNAQAWLDQFEKTTSEKSIADLPKDPRQQRGTPVDLLRHQLQMTVMLNTLASIRHGGYFVKGREVRLKVNKGMKTIVYSHESKLRKSDKMPTKTPYPQTRIKVDGNDCVVVYQNLVKQGKNPVLLNMASATSPGGGYRKGDGAQEENLFRRSDYFRSLDVEMDGFLSQRSDRFRCTSDGREEALPQTHKMYPMDEFGGIYTSGLTFFRHSQDVGYEYLDRPIEDVCAIAMAAYRDPKLDDNLLSRKPAVGTRKKIENVFSIALHHGHDSIVLSAFGCGAFRNPPGHIARIFFSVIEQYAGFFDTIVFAIIDDHNSGQRLNPQGNLKPFIDALEGRSTKVETPMNKPDTMFGPYRVSSDGTKFNNIKIFDLSPCCYAAKCTQIGDPKHTSEYSHPPLCARAANNGKCDLTQHLVHERSFIHRKQCQYGGDCYNISDKKHCEEFDHPAECPQRGACQIMDDGHLKQYRHLPICKESISCLEFLKHNSKHCEQYRHCQPSCQFGNCCIRFHDKDHIKEKKHPFITPCPRTPFHCSDYDIFSEATDTATVSKNVQKHCLAFSHVCRFGRNCKDPNSLHQEKAIHIIRNLCPYDGKCNKMHEEEHLNSFTHTGVADIRRVCREEICKDRYKKEHLLKYRHHRSHEESGVVHYYGLNTGIDFVQNQCDSITRIFAYIKKHKWAPLPSDTVPSNILNWFRTVRPVHRCTSAIFESILLQGHCMSRDYMEKLKSPKFVATSVMQHPRIRRIKSLDISTYAQVAKEYVIAIVSNEYDRANFPASLAPPGGIPPPPPKPGVDLANHDIVIKKNEKTLSTAIPSKDVDVIKNKAIEIAQASIKLHQHLPGIGHGPDKDLRTDKRVFSILGPHLGHYYGDVFIVFKREILHHPDADYSMLAATTFATSGNAYKWRPWLQPDPVDLSKRIEHYHNSKFHASIPGHEYAIALEMMAITSLESKFNSMAVDLNSIIQRWVHIDSHRTIEAHLPQLIPLDYIDHIYMPQSIFDSLSQSSRRSIDALFKHCIDVTPHNVPAVNPMGPAGVQPATKERADYQNYVIKDLLERCKHDSQNPPARPIEGAVITIPASSFQSSFVVPLTISQACDLYQMQHKANPSDDVVYIYWQAFHGDMMLVLSSGILEGNNDEQPNLRCLLCYIAPKVGSDESYHEQTTYINCGSPFKHHEFVTKAKYKVRSDTFHLGSNTDDFVTYCLTINRTTGRVILRQAGANAIYNHEEISYEFTNKKELDVSKLEYVHVSANAKSVTVRNLIVSFERRSELHPTFDRTFKKDTSKPVGKAPIGGGASGGPPMIPCRDNVNCLLQYSMSSEGKDHNSKYSHPCRYSELCRNKGSCPCTHDSHRSSPCRDDKKCRKMTDPFHRAKYRHTDLPDFLVPCRDQKCPNTTDDHRTKYSHGEDVFEKKPAAAGAGTGSDDSRFPCKYGLGCRNIDDKNHQAKYSHK